MFSFFGRTLERAEAFPEHTFDAPEPLQKEIEKYNEISIDGAEILTVSPSDNIEQTERYSGKKAPHREGAHDQLG